MNPATFRSIHFCGPIIPPSWNQRSSDIEGALKKFEEDATKAGYTDVGEYRKDVHKTDPRILEASARLYRECAAKHGAEGPECEFYKEYLLECKAVQNGS